MPVGKKKKPTKEGSRLKRTFERAGRAAHAAATPFLKLYLREKHMRVRVLVLNEEKEALLVRSWFSHQKWSLPGGGIKSTEIPAEAAVRETFEETGLRIGLEHMRELGTFTNPSPKAAYTVACYTVTIPKRDPIIARQHRLEMLDVSWFPLASLPKERSPLVDLAVSLLK